MPNPPINYTDIQLDFLADMYAKLWSPPPLSPFPENKNKKVDFFAPFLYIYQSNRNALKWTIL